MSSVNSGVMFETFIACVRMPMSPSPPPSAATALASGRAVAAAVRNTKIKMIRAAMKPKRNGGTPLLLALALERVAGELDLKVRAAQCLELVEHAGEVLQVVVIRRPGDVDQPGRRTLGGVQQFRVACADRAALRAVDRLPRRADLRDLVARRAQLDQRRLERRRRRRERAGLRLQDDGAGRAVLVGQAGALENVRNRRGLGVRQAERVFVRRTAERTGDALARPR